MQLSVSCLIATLLVLGDCYSQSRINQQSAINGYDHRAAQPNGRTAITGFTKKTSNMQSTSRRSPNNFNILMTGNTGRRSALAAPPTHHHSRFVKETSDQHLPQIARRNDRQVVNQRFTSPTQRRGGSSNNVGENPEMDHYRSRHVNHGSGEFVEPDRFRSDSANPEDAHNNQDAQMQQPSHVVNYGQGSFEAYSLEGEEPEEYVDEHIEMPTYEEVPEYELPEELPDYNEEQLPQSARKCNADIGRKPVVYQAFIIPVKISFGGILELEEKHANNPLGDNLEGDDQQQISDLSTEIKPDKATAIWLRMLRYIQVF